MSTVDLKLIHEPDHAAELLEKIANLGRHLAILEEQARNARFRRDQVAAELHSLGVPWRTIATAAGTSHVALQKRAQPSSDE